MLYEPTLDTQLALLCSSSTPPVFDMVLGEIKPFGHHPLPRAAAKFLRFGTKLTRPAVHTCLTPTQPSKAGFQNNLEISYKQILGEPVQT